MEEIKLSDEEIKIIKRFLSLNEFYIKQDGGLGNRRLENFRKEENSKSWFKRLFN